MTTGVYVYGVAAGDAAVPEGAGALDPRFPLRSLAAEGLRAIVSDVALDELGEEAIAAHAEDRSWLEAKVRAHEAVLDRALGAGVVPFRFGTVVRDDDAVRQLLHERRNALRAALRRVDAKREWGVKVLVDDEALTAWTGSRDERAAAFAGTAATATAGRAYFARKQLDRVVAEESAERAAAWAGEIHERLAAVAAEARTNPIPRPELSGYALPIVLNGAYLVGRDGDDAFAEAVAAAEHEYAERGLSCALSGPWPPYNFVGEDVE